MADCFLKIDGIPGESTDEKHKDWIEVLSFSHGVSQMAGGDRSTGGAATEGRCMHQDFSITKTLDKASPPLDLFCCNGKHIPKVVVDEVEGDPGYYSAKFYLRPHYQLEGLSVSLRLVSKLPSAKKG